MKLELIALMLFGLSSNWLFIIFVVEPARINQLVANLVITLWVSSLIFLVSVIFG